ncbi:uncharacterized protein V1516DRAFT_685334 [Lipomyces oligophaga]|uniref:uncharacterized protein n=1 Tax=Lipomyces oligophaga TaxID=45792 RepID=UPI0034CE5E28
MIKTGATVLWQRLPIHLTTTIPQLANFGIYSDAPDSINGVPVINTLANISNTSMLMDVFDGYHRQVEILDNHYNLELWTPEANVRYPWDMDKFKNVPMVYHAYHTMPVAKWYIFMDADTFIFWDGMFKWLDTLNSDDLLYLGSAAMMGGELFAHGGSGVIMSGALIRKVFDVNNFDFMKWEHRADTVCCGDFVISRLFHEAGVDVPNLAEKPAEWRIQGEPPKFVYFGDGKWCEQILTFHHVTPHDINELRQFEIKHKSETILYRDIYKEFVMPYLQVGRQEHWDNQARALEFTAKDDQDEPAHKSYDNCRQKCIEWDGCLEFRYKQGYCGMADWLVYGVRDVQPDGKTYSSEWMLDRIRELRKRSGCDSDILPYGQDEGSFWQS